jgi:hypothetical protein
MAEQRHRQDSRKPQLKSKLDTNLRPEPKGFDHRGPFVVAAFFGGYRRGIEPRGFFRLAPDCEGRSRAIRDPRAVKDSANATLYGQTGDRAPVGSARTKPAGGSHFFAGSSRGVRRSTL